MRRSFFTTFLTLLPNVWLLSASTVSYPTSYRGGVGRVIHTTLTLLGPNVYTYDEWTHAGYSVHDSGHYEVRNQRLLLSSILTVHETRNNWKRVNGHRVALPDAHIYGRLFRHTTAHLDADTIVIKKRRVLYNRGFHMYLVKNN